MDSVKAVKNPVIEKQPSQDYPKLRSGSSWPNVTPWLVMLMYAECSDSQTLETSFK